MDRFQNPAPTYAPETPDRPLENDRDFGDDEWDADDQLWWEFVHQQAKEDVR